MAVDLGNVPDWIQAIGASGALIYIAVQHQFDRKRSREAKREAERLRQDSEAAQARQVAIVPSWHYNEVDGCFVAVKVLNDSGRLIRHVVLAAEDDETGADGLDFSTAVDDPEEYWFTIDQITAGSSGTMRARVRHQPVTTLEQSRIFGYHDSEEHAAFELNLRYTVSVVFTDASGLIWRQWHHGYPERLTTWTPPAGIWRWPARKPKSNPDDSKQGPPAQSDRTEIRPGSGQDLGPLAGH